MGATDRWWRSLFDIGKDNYTKTMERKRVYCKECQFFNKEANYWYYLAGHGGQSSEEFNYRCEAPQNHKRQIGWYHDFKERTPRYEYPKTPYSLNYNNDCKWFKRVEVESDWEVK